ncbi:ead/Ea22-like family protein [Enterobacter quasihormaechei]|uniref:ead/Ea22-like family protein n=1 Tax=Enterobacter quasihormaechei TaxID=2529382 RepID=UPI002F3E81A7
MSNIDKQALRERYSPQPVPKCHICGAEMTIQRMSASRITYGCTGATYDDAGCHYTVGRSIADYHYAQSRITVVDMSDPDVLALLDDLEAAESGFPPLTVERLMREKDDLKKRLVELEARMVKLPERYEVDMCPTPSPDGEWYSRDDVLAALLSAGVSYADGIGEGE